jgi:hypothetical protein
VPKKRKKDLALVYGPADEGEGFKILRKRAQNDEVEAGVIRPLKEGRAIHGEVIKLQARPETPFVFEVETDAELSSPATDDARGRPAQVANDKYRRGWDGIFGRGRTHSTPN